MGFLISFGCARETSALSAVPPLLFRAANARFPPKTNRYLMHSDLPASRPAKAATRQTATKPLPARRRRRPSLSGPGRLIS